MREHFGSEYEFWSSVYIREFSIICIGKIGWARGKNERTIKHLKKNTQEVGFGIKCSQKPL